MANVEIKVEGKEETIAKLQKQHEEYGTILSPVVLKYTKQAVKEYRDLAPVGKTKNLRNSISQKMITQTRNASFIKGTARSVIARKGRKGYHRHLVAYGTRMRETSDGRSRGVKPENRKFASAKEKLDSLKFDVEIEAILKGDKEI